MIGPLNTYLNYILLGILFNNRYDLTKSFKIIQKLIQHNLMAKGFLELILPFLTFCNSKNCTVDRGVNYKYIFTFLLTVLSVVELSFSFLVGFFFKKIFEYFLKEKKRKNKEEFIFFCFFLDFFWSV